MSRESLQSSDYPPYLSGLDQCGNPDCSQISDSAYQDTFIGRRRTDQPIYYGFSTVNFWKYAFFQLGLIFSGVIPHSPSNKMRDSMRAKTCA